MRRAGPVTTANLVLLAFNVVAAVLIVTLLWRVGHRDIESPVRLSGEPRSPRETTSPNVPAPRGGTESRQPLDRDPDRSATGGSTSPFREGDRIPQVPPGDSARGASAARRGDSRLEPPQLAPSTSAPPPVPAAPTAPSKPAPAARGPNDTTARLDGPRPAVPGAVPPASPKATDKKKDEAPPVEQDPASDRTPPVLVSLRLDPSGIADGQSATLTIEMTDDLSGVLSVAGRVRSPSGRAIVSFQTQGDAGGNVFTAIVAVPVGAETGEWFVSDLFAEDRAHNQMTASYTRATVPGGGTLVVSSSTDDSHPPVVREIWLDKNTVGDGESNIVRVAVEDDRSGVASVTGAFQSPSRSAGVTFACHAGADPGVWEGNVVVPAKAECGDWSLLELWVKDKADNSARLPNTAPPVANVSFNVADAACDSTPPVLEWITLDPTSVSNDAPARIVVTASVVDEGTGTNSVFVAVTGPPSTNGQVPRIELYLTHTSNDAAAPWTGTIVVPQYAAKGTWKVSLVQVRDKASNARDYKSDDPMVAGAVFEVR